MLTIEIENSKGLALVADIYPTQSKKLVILVHGFTGERHEAGRFDRLAEALHTSSYNVLTFDFSGCGESANAVLTIENHIDDLRSVIKYVKSLGIEHIGIVGFSLGALVACRGFDEHIKSLVFWAPVTAKKLGYARRFTDTERNELESTGYITYHRDRGTRQVMSIGKEMIAARETLDQAELLSHITIPVLIVHGTQDERIPFTDSEKALDYLPEGSELQPLAGANHTFDNALQRAIGYTLKWFSEHL